MRCAWTHEINSIALDDFTCYYSNFPRTLANLMLLDEWVDEQTLELLNSADNYYLLLCPSVIFMVIFLRVFIEIGFEFFVNN